MNRAVFLDRDGVLIEEVHLLVDPARVRLFPWTAEAVSSLKQEGFKLLAVSNQTVVARGMASCGDVEGIHAAIQELLAGAGGAKLDGFYFCPHHPEATLQEYRVECECRKPRPGMLLQAAREHGIDLGRSYMIGDRITDVLAGARAGCATILVESGAHRAPPIRTAEPIDESVRPDHVCGHLGEAAALILEHAS